MCWWTQHSTFIWYEACKHESSVKHQTMLNIAQMQVWDTNLEVMFQGLCISTRYTEDQISNSSQSQLGTGPGSFDDSLCSSAMTNMWASSLKLFFNLSWPFSLSPTHLSFSPARFKILGPANRRNRSQKKKSLLFLSVMFYLSCKKILVESWRGGWLVHSLTTNCIDTVRIVSKKFQGKTVLQI